MPTERKSPIGAFGLIVFSTIFSLVLAEIVMRVASPFPTNFSSNKVAHPVLGYVLDSGLDDVDDFGFRNADSSARGAPIAAIGDSHTYGQPVFVSQSWPYIVSEETGQGYYNYGVPGYSPYQYFHLVQQAIDDGAEVILIGLALHFDGGSDLELPCRFQGTAGWKNFQQGTDRDYSELCSKINQGEIIKERSLSYRLKEFLIYDVALTSAFYNLVVVKLQFMTHAERTRYYMKDGDLYFRVVSPNPELQTEMSVMDSIIMGIARTCRLNGVRCGFVLFPSLGRVISEMNGSGYAVKTMTPDTINIERSVVDRYKKFMADNNIIFVDSAPYIADEFKVALNTGSELDVIVPWDSHPRARGYAAYASAALELYRKLEASDAQAN